MRAVFLGLAVVLLLAGVAGADLAFNTAHRVVVIEQLCKAGLPNLSRPAEVDEDRLGCTVLSGKQRVKGFVTTDFEHSVLTIGDHIELDSNGIHFHNQSAWFSGWAGLEQRGGDALGRELSIRRPGLCGGRMAKVEVEGWMTLSPGGYGHLNMAEREFYAYRVISAEPPLEADIQPFRRTNLPDAPPGFDEFCLERERPDYEGL